jgi:hypothetical protein
VPAARQPRGDLRIALGELVDVDVVILLDVGILEGLDRQLTVVPPVLVDWLAFGPLPRVADRGERLG